MGRSDPGKDEVPLGGNRKSKGMQLRNATEWGRDCWIVSSAFVDPRIIGKGIGWEIGQDGRLVLSFGMAKNLSEEC